MVVVAICAVCTVVLDVSTMHFVGFDLCKLGMCERNRFHQVPTVWPEFQHFSPTHLVSGPSPCEGSTRFQKHPSNP